MWWLLVGREGARNQPLWMRGMTQFFFVGVTSYMWTFDCVGVFHVVQGSTSE